MRAVSALLVLSFACIRNPKDLPGPQEGGFVSGIVVEQSLITGDTAGVSGALVSEIGTNTKLEAGSDGRFILERLPNTIQLALTASDAAPAELRGPQRLG